MSGVAGRSKSDRRADATELQPQNDVWTLQGLYGSPGDEDHFRIVLDTAPDSGTTEALSADGGAGPTAAAVPDAPTRIASGLAASSFST